MNVADSPDSSDSSGNGGFDDSERAPHPLRMWRQPLLTAVTASVAVGLVSIVAPNPGPLVLTAVLSLTLARNRLVTTWRGRLEALVLLPVVGLAVAGVAFLLLNLPIVGASAFVIALFLSIWLRRFGPMGSRIGSLIALPFITLLISPGGGAGTTPLGVALLSVVVLVVVVALRLLAEVVRLIPRPVRPHSAATGTATDGASVPSQPATTPKPVAPRPRKIEVSTRMAIQMAVALAAGWAFGFWLFPQHVTWVVLTAFIVCSGNRGRADVLYKSGLRIVGAAFGTALASVSLALIPAGQSGLQGPPLVIVLLAIIAVGMWLREWTYAAWAVVMTLVITLLQGAIGSATHGVSVPEGIELWIRIVAIILGAALGVLASWFVLPVRSEDVVRGRVARALAALNDFAAAPDPETDSKLAESLERLDEVAAPWAAWERVSRWRVTDRKPGQWMNLVHECARLVRARPALSVGARRALGEARRSMRDPQAIGPALTAFRDELMDGATGAADATGTNG